jgi:hypothetical protein
VKAGYRQASYKRKTHQVGLVNLLLFDVLFFLAHTGYGAFMGTANSR